jgi:hypothetical protein
MRQPCYDDPLYNEWVMYQEGLADAFVASLDAVCDPGPVPEDVVWVPEPCALLWVEPEWFRREWEARREAGVGGYDGVVGG